MISERTKAALQSKKEQGFLLGTPQNLTFQARSKGVEAIKQNALAHENNQKASAVARLLKSQLNESQKGRTLREIAAELNRLGFRTRHGRSFHPMTVKRLLEGSPPGKLNREGR